LEEERQKEASRQWFLRELASRYERKKIIEEIWSELIQHVAKRYRLSDVGLAKVTITFSLQPNVRFKVKEDFKKPHAWDLGTRFRRVRKQAGIKDLRIHDLRHFGTTVLVMDENADATIAN